jgi:hypothetical protein
MHLLKVIVTIILLQALSFMERWTMKLNELGRSISSVFGQKIERTECLNTILCHFLKFFAERK